MRHESGINERRLDEFLENRPGDFKILIASGDITLQF